MAGDEIGDVYVRIRADGSGFSADVVEATETASQEAERKADKGGSRIGKVLGGALKGGAIAAATGIGLVLTAGVAKGFQRLTSIDQAEAKLRGLGITGEQLSGVMANALDSVKGTAFGLDEAVSAVPGLLAAGVKPGQELTQALKNMGSTATLAGTSFGEISDVFTDAAASGRVTTDTLDRMAARGIPALQMVADHLGVTREEAQKMASSGQISFQTFQDALSKSIGPAALEAGNSFQGMLANTMAALGRLGASVLGPVFNGLKTVMPTLIAAFDQIGAAVGPAMDKVAPKIEGLFQSIADGIAGVDWEGVINAIVDITSALIDWAPAILAVVAAIGLWKAGMAISTAIGAAQAAIAGFNAALLGLQLAAGSSAAALTGFNVAQKLMTVLTIAGKAATVVATAVQWAWNAALTANPIGIIIVAIGALVAALVWFFTQTELGQELWSGFIDWLVAAWTNIASFFQTLWAGIVEVFTAAWEGIVNFLTPIFEFIATLIRVYIEVWINIFLILAAVLKTVWDAIVAVVTWAWEGIVAFLTPIITAIADFITRTFDAISSWWNGLWDGIASWFEDTWNGLVMFVVPIISRIIAAVRGPIQGLVAWWNSLWSGISSFFSTIWNGMVTAVSNAVNLVVNAVRSIKDRIMGFFSGVGMWLYNIGRDIITGLINGITSMFQNIVNAIGDVVNGAIDWAKSVLKIGSPSRVFADIGKDLGRGFVDGIASMQSEVEGAVGDLAVGGVQVAQTVIPAGAAAASNTAGQTPVSTTTTSDIDINVIGDLHPERTAMAVNNALAERVAVLAG